MFFPQLFFWCFFLGIVTRDSSQDNAVLFGVRFAARACPITGHELVIHPYDYETACHRFSYQSTARKK